MREKVCILYYFMSHVSIPHDCGATSREKVSGREDI